MESFDLSYDTLRYIVEAVRKYYSNRSKYEYAIHISKMPIEAAKTSEFRIKLLKACKIEHREVAAEIIEFDNGIIAGVRGFMIAVFVPQDTVKIGKDILKAIKNDRNGVVMAERLDFTDVDVILREDLDYKDINKRKIEFGNVYKLYKNAHSEDVGTPEQAEV